MSETNSAATRRLARLERVLAARRARLAASTVVRRRAPPAASGAAAYLQANGYRIALLLAAAAVLPTVIGFLARRPTKPLVEADSRGTSWLRALVDLLNAAEDDR